MVRITDQKIADRLMLAAVSCTIASLPSHVLLRLLQKHPKLNFNYPFDEMGGGLFLTGRAAKTPLGRLTGFIVNSTNNMGFSAALTYLLSAIGRDIAVLKGIGLSVGTWVLIQGMVSGSLLKNRSKNPSTLLISLTLHMLTGALNGLLISKLGDDALFPDEQINQGTAKDPSQKVPLIARLTNKPMG